MSKDTGHHYVRWTPWRWEVEIELVILDVLISCHIALRLVHKSGAHDLLLV